MDIRRLTAELWVSPQIAVADVADIAAAGFRSIICNRPDGEGSGQPLYVEMERAAREAGLRTYYLPAESGKVADAQGVDFGAVMRELPKPVLAYCLTGMRSTTMWALSQAGRIPGTEIIERSLAAGHDLKAVVRGIVNGGKTPVEVVDASHEVVIIGGGAAGIAVASSLMERTPRLDVAIVDPADIHYYQPGWTMVGGGVFDAATPARTMGLVLPRGVRWIKSAVAAFEPERNAVVLDGCRVVKYARLVVCPGLKLDWQGIEGLSDTLGRNGVTSNYRYDLAPYTWELVRKLKGGKVAPTFPKWLMDGTRPSRLAWYLKERLLPPLYWHAMLKGREWLVEPEIAS